MTTVTSDDMRSKLLTLDQARDSLAATEPLTEVEFDTAKEQAVFTLPDEWNEGLKDKDGMEVTEAAVAIDGNEYKLTKDAILEATSLIQLTKDYVTKTPGPLVQDHLNYWMSHGNRQLKILLSPKLGDQVGQAFAKASIEPFSNLKLLDEALDAIAQVYSTDDVLVDPKFQHDLRRTAFRLIVPEKSRMLETPREGDVWSLGLQVRNSLVGEKPLSLSGYMFAWVCDNGSVSTHAASGNYNRRSMGQGLKVYEWAKHSIEEILGGLEHELDSVQELTSVKLENEVTDTLAALFKRYQIPLSSREGIIAALIESDDLTAYGLMQAVTSAANMEGLHDKARTELMLVGGDIPHTMSERCSACHQFSAA